MKNILNIKDKFIVIFGTIIFSTMSLAATGTSSSGKSTGSASLAGFETFSNYLKSAFIFFKWAVGIFGIILLAWGFIEFMADNTQFTRLITKLIVAAFCIGAAMNADKILESLGGATIDYSQILITKNENKKSISYLRAEQNIKMKLKM